ncbi:MAG: Flp pilus assembly complex ATPase component TadA [Sedimentisphaerales bacterium]|nr:Flp pilus assembly complex ATPase component TadA [Sedimentisphaerales bacterium]
MKEKLLEIARDTKLVDEGQLRRFMADHNGGGRGLEEALLETTLFSEGQVLKLFGEYYGLEFVEQILPNEVPAEFLTVVPANYAQQHALLAVAKEDGVLKVATSNPLNFYPLDNVGKMVGCTVRPVLAIRAIINAAINGAYEHRVTVLEEVAGEVDAQNIEGLLTEVSSSEDLLDVVNRPPVIRLVNDILFRALQLRASDVHIHPLEQTIHVRYRIDGIMYDMLTLDYRTLPLVVSRVKVMAGMDIAERRMPQDGRCSVKIGPREVDLRVSTVPTSYGERTVLRLLDKSSGLLDMSDLGLNPSELKKIDLMLRRPHGVFFVTGPTGSGKTTTLYSFLRRINSIDKNIITIEDPIEYQLEGISQIQVASKKGMTFVTSLRHVLRQDPDVIMVGEVRDEETARMVIQSSLTGHLVFSTLHTNDSAGAITRMLDLSVEPYLVSSSVIGVLAQRLIRRLCMDCKECVTADSAKMRELGLGFAGFEKVYTSRGCEKCFNTGYRGRAGIYEFMPVDDDIRQCIYQRKTASTIKKVAMEAGLISLRMDGLQKVEAGITSIEEVLRVAQADEI